MQREYHVWHSPHLGRDMEMLVFGHAGSAVLIFPTRDGRFHEYEDLRIVERLRPWIEAGSLQLFCLDNIAHESLYCFWCRPEDRVHRYLAYERYVLDEVLPLITRLNPNGERVAHGLSLGGYFAANFAFRHPALIDRLVACSGRYDLTRPVEHFQDLFAGHYDDSVYFNTPLHFLPDLHEPVLLAALRRMRVILAVGRDDPFHGQNHELRRILCAKGVDCQIYDWDGRAHQGWAWRRMAPIYLPPTPG
ncbi:MAG: alpha/beta hydrolase-fold protein [Pseudomonadota bacterium]